MSAAAPAADAPRPLDGLRVVDVGTFIAGPYAASIMAEFGAEVLKVEHPVAGDPFRRFGTPTERENATLAWLSEARNKKSVTINLRVAEGAELFRRLVATADVLIENFRPGMLESWGLTPEALTRDNPGLVMLRVTGYGQTGPYRDRPGFAHLAHAFGGLSYLAGFPGQPPVVPGSSPLGDYMSSLLGLIGVLIALRHREVSGRGQIVDIGIYEAVFRQLDELAAAYGLAGRIRQREGAGTVIACPHGHFETRDGHWVAIACTNDKMFARLAEDAMERPELASTGLYGVQANRLAAREEVTRIVGDWTRSLDRAELMAKCLAAEVPIGPLNSIEDIFSDEHFQARGNLVTRREEDIGEVVVPGVTPRLSATPGRIDSLGPRFGEATRAVLAELLGLTDHEIERLRRDMVI